MGCVEGQRVTGADVHGGAENFRADYPETWGGAPRSDDEAEEISSESHDDTSGDDGEDDRPGGRKRKQAAEGEEASGHSPALGGSGSKTCRTAETLLHGGGPKRDVRAVGVLEEGAGKTARTSGNLPKRAEPEHNARKTGDEGGRCKIRRTDAKPAEPVIAPASGEAKGRGRGKGGRKGNRSETNGSHNGGSSTDGRSMQADLHEEEAGAGRQGTRRRRDLIDEEGGGGTGRGGKIKRGRGPGR